MTQFANEPAALDDQIAVADAHQFLEFGRGDQNGCAGGRELDSQRQDFALGADVETAGGLVEKEDRRQEASQRENTTFC